MKVLYFAWLAERLGHPEETFETELRTADELRRHLQELYPDQAEIFADPHTLRIAVNQQLVDWSHPLTPNDEIALFPPMTGG